ncbi:metal-dependent transcriptional regulator [Candidatus Omnitrophota bacterium]
MAAKDNKLSANMEDYLEAIANLKAEKGVARVKDISTVLGVKKPSVTGAMNLLAAKGLIIHERYGYIDLSAKGKRLAKLVKERHDMLTKFFSEVLRISPHLAEEDACKIEHSLSQTTFNKLTKFIEFIENSTQGKRPTWLKNFDNYVASQKSK